MKKNKPWLTVLMVFLGIILTCVGAIMLNQFELSGNNKLDYLRFVLSFGAIIVGVMAIAKPFVDREKKE